MAGMSIYPTRCLKMPHPFLDAFAPKRSLFAISFFERVCSVPLLEQGDDMSLSQTAALCIFVTLAAPVQAQAWLNCVPNSIGPGGCDSIAPGGGKSIAPGGGQSIGPGGGRSIAPGGGQSIAPNGGRSIAPGGGLAPDRNWRRGLDPNTLRPAPDGEDPYQ